jgi:LAS superfamily LD-carboxypeptidase LdcB
VIAFIVFAAVIFLGIKVVVKYAVKKPALLIQNNETLPFKRITMLNPTPLYANPDINDVLQETVPAGTVISVDKIVKNKWTFFRIKTESSYRWVIAQFVQHIPVNIPQGQNLPIGREIINVNNPLPYHYKPGDLHVVNKKYLSPYDMRKHALREEALKVFCKIIDDARKDGIKLVIVSAFRSAHYQMRLYKNALNKKNNPDWMGTAKPTYSEHQLGTAVDLSSPEIGYDLNESFENTRAYFWLKSRLEKYGIRLSYPRNNAEGYIYEPWHYRYMKNRQN